MGSDASIYREIQATIDSIEGDATLGEVTNFVSRAEAIDFIEFHVIDRINGMSHAGDLTKLKRRAESLKRRLETIDEALLQEIRTTLDPLTFQLIMTDGTMDLLRFVQL